MTIELYDKQEKLVRTAESKSGKVNLDTNNLQPGTYFLLIQSGKEVVRKQVVIK
ncbi:T9SS type A sorting domain-containing protein [Negadavirga shengliensis]|uniref:T9SS type A sorting domain-containing protein n=1 Tax=Negadavirga shengliensis TaxID=1389218 RepID=A0ABV9T1G6_9BACT